MLEPELQGKELCQTTPKLDPSTIAMLCHVDRASMHAYVQDKYLFQYIIKRGNSPLTISPSNYYIENLF